MTSSRAEARRPSPPCILATGFEPFGAHISNPSWDALTALDWPVDAPYRLERHRLPVDYQAVASELPRLYATLRPAAVVHFGVMSERGLLRLESRAQRQLGDCPDNRGFLPPKGDAAALLSEPEARKADQQRNQSLDLEAIREALQRRAILFRDSDDAGGFLCNFTLYISLGLAADDSPPGGVGFIHVPSIDETFSVSRLSEAMLLILQSLCLSVSRNSD